MAFRNDETKYVDDTKNIPVTVQRGSTTLSPYLNFDPAYIPARQPEYIFPEGAPKRRGQFELSFSQIGGAFIAAGTVGGALGLHRGIKATVGQTGKPRRIQILNHIVKNGSSLSNTFGLVTLMYSGIGVVLGWARGTDDFVNTLAAGTATGMVYKCTAGLKKCAMAGGIGFGIASIYCLWVNRDSLKELRSK